MACLPIETYDEVLKFKNFRPCWKNAVQPLSHVSDTCYPGVRFQCHAGNFDLVQERRKRRTVPKTLFCHDLKGGYLEDRFVDGSSKHDEYRFFHWTGIDTFVYFSHKLVTIPPPGWINAAHLHGTKVLGTLITEWKEGEKIWQKITESDESVEEFADCLVEICINFGFDGYLLNVENIILPEQVTRLELFISLLYNKLHGKIPHAELLWYDSVTTEGKLEWQNELNVKNRSFMEKCDGIFLNYSWNENNLKQSAENAGKRLLDIYVGIDVFGRNFYGGGGYNSCKAVELARKYNLSLAIFAPSWVHEYLGGPHFVHLEYVFWHTLWPYLYLHGPTGLPFSTTFCQGYGEKLYNNGEVVSSSPWYNLSKQQYQPTVPSCQGDQFVDIICTAKKDAEERRKVKSKEGEEVNTDIPDEVYEKSGELITAGCVQHYSRDAFNGGGCLQITKSSSEISSNRIFICDFKCDGEYLVSVATKPVCEDKADIIVLLKSENNTGICRTWTLKSGVKHTSERNVVIPLKQSEIEKLRHKVDEDLFTTLCATASSDWKLRHHLIELNETIIEVRVELTPTGSSALLGLFQIYPVEQ